MASKRPTIAREIAGAALALFSCLYFYVGDNNVGAVLFAAGLFGMWWEDCSHAK
jgi:hypothetical protein